MEHEVIIIGAGHAGLSTSYYLQQSGVNHLVLERGDVGHAWRSQRWDNFRLNTGNKFNTLPGDDAVDPEAFGTAHALATSMKDYVSRHKLPVTTGATVTSVETIGNAAGFVVSLETDGKERMITSRQVVVASGSQNTKRVSPLSTKLPPRINQLHSCEYRNAASLPEGSVLIIGSGQSGCQIAEDLVMQGRKVYLATSLVPRCPRYYRGKDIMDWLVTLGFFEARVQDLPDPAMKNLRTPLLKGTGTGRESLSLQGLRQTGVNLLGKLTDVAGEMATFTDDVSTKIAFADNFSLQVKKMIDDHIKANDLQIPTDIPDEDNDRSLESTAHNSATTTMKLNEVSSVIWATGFTHNFDYLKMPVFDETGSPIYHEGISEINGLYFLGLHWLKNRKSDILFGIKEDAQRIAAHISNIAERRR